MKSNKYINLIRKLDSSGVVTVATDISKDIGNYSFKYDDKLYNETFTQKPELIILGGGHVSLGIAKISKMLGFKITVVDEREEFANKTRFDMVDKIICANFEEAFEQIPDKANNYYVIVTRGHSFDEICCKCILSRKYSYLGMIGSKGKVKITFDNLISFGFSKEQIDSIHAPIGLKIGSQTPEEIAVSIMAEIIQEKSKYKYSVIEDDFLCGINEETSPYIVANIVNKSGSAPRGIGARMLITPNKTYGTIGGGSAEYEAIKYGRKLIDTKEFPCIKKFVLNSNDTDLKMICGGEILVLFEN